MGTEQKKENCPCKRKKCERYGDCEACRAHHNSRSEKSLPYCDRPKQRAARKPAKKNRP